MLGEESKLTLVLPTQNHTAENVQEEIMSQAESTSLGVSQKKITGNYYIELY
jgi:hypothetical protein